MSKCGNNKRLKLNVNIIFIFYLNIDLILLPTYLFLMTFYLVY